MTSDKNQESITDSVELKINGRDIKLNNFVQTFVSETIIGMVKSLRGVGDIEAIDLKILKKTKNSQVK